MAKKYYAVKKGRNTGIFTSWEPCRASVTGYSGAQYKSFSTLEEAEDYLEGNREAVAESSKEEDKDICTAYVDGSFDLSKKAYSYGCILLYQGERREISRAFVGEKMFPCAMWRENWREPWPP